MQIKAEEISSIIKEKIKGFDKQVDVKETGSVIQVGDGIAKVYGLDGAMAGEMLEFPGGLYGIALNLEEDNVGAVLMGDDVGVKEGDPVKRTGRIAEIPVGEALNRSCGQRDWTAHRWQGPDQVDALVPHRSGCPRREYTSVGARTLANGHQGHRRHDPHRPRPA